MRQYYLSEKNKLKENEKPTYRPYFKSQGDQKQTYFFVLYVCNILVIHVQCSHHCGQKSVFSSIRNSCFNIRNSFSNFKNSYYFLILEIYFLI